MGTISTLMLVNKVTFHLTPASDEVILKAERTYLICILNVPIFICHAYICNLLCLYLNPYAFFTIIGPILSLHSVLCLV